ncbi:hypothetical protein HYT23_03480 [Candidatus Pacearchaeota archaeon]|nr:hypothetical protein [Candidatus Pacearchaeota archaeon]
MAKELPERLKGCPDSMSTPDFKKFEALADGAYKNVIISFNADSDISRLEDYLLARSVSKEKIERINGLRRICVSLTKKQIYDVAGLDYVNSVMEDTIIFGYHAPKKD